ncbi:hypothetical protein, partial [Kutzneria sp. 744]|uniref:hypothetical protein n=1 Tax=Kutzneria sp. (strain 744) TaxID=345341 RepID=UPI001E41EE8C
KKKKKEKKKTIQDQTGPKKKINTTAAGDGAWRTRTSTPYYGAKKAKVAVPLPERPLRSS